MRLSLRFIVPLALALALIAYAVIPLVDRLTERWFVRDLDIRSTLITNAVQEPLYEALQAAATKGGRAQLPRYLERILRDERLYGLAFCDLRGSMVYRTAGFPDEVKCSTYEETALPSIISLDRGPVHLSITRAESQDAAYGRLLLLHDMSFVQRRSDDTKRYLFLLFVCIAAVVSLITVVIAHLSWRGWVAGLKTLIKGQGLLQPTEEIRFPGLGPVAQDLRTLIRDLESDRRARDESEISWNPGALRSILREELKGEEVVIVSNREPYIHVHGNKGIEVRRPASGLVTALEPVMKACSGIWIAHGSGDADRESVDRGDHVAVPPGKPAYSLRRLWLTREEEQGHYYGFSNGGLWPLCHIAHVRPVFRGADWNAYVAVNRRFAEAVVEEAKSENPIVLVQDYHFALLPRMLRERLPDATVITFWHIPWPNPEAFGICPWREAILDGMLGSSILGFHTQFHCNNFLDTVDRYLEARVDRENFSVSFGGEPTLVRRYPISIAWPLEAEAMGKPVEECRQAIRALNGLGPDLRIGVGVDRMDYTKGILERMSAVERLLELRPEWRRRFTFIQIASPSRTSIDEYREFDARVRAMAASINERFADGEWRPLVLKVEHHEPEQVYEYYRGADLCFVSSLHDGMNLVAKEFVASRDDERGVLILSQFTGASRELAESLIVNPYNIDQCAAALQVALTMPPAEQRARMRGMRALLQEFNVYRWAGRMLLDAVQMRTRRAVLARDPVASKRIAAGAR